MRILRRMNQNAAKLFEKGGRFERFYPLFEAHDTFLFTPGNVTRTASHVRDGLDLKRMMVTVVAALLPCMLMAMYNTGYQAALAVDAGHLPLEGWRTQLFTSMGFAFDPGNLLGCFIYGALFFVPVYLVTIAIGGAWEALFAIVRKHEINEGFLVTSALFPLILPPTIPLWQVALGISFGVVIAKEIYGGVGMNILNPALASRAFLFFAYPAAISGDQPWVAAVKNAQIDAWSGATFLSRAAAEGQEALTQGVSWMHAFLGFIPGSMGETSTLACLIGAAVLILTGIGSWRVMFGVTLGTVLMTVVFNLIGSETNPMFEIPFWWHMALGGWAFGTVFMATDPVSAAYTNKGRYVYGFCIGVLVILIRVVNPAFPEGMMLAILLMNVFSPLIDHFVVRANIKRRLARNAA